MDILTTAGNLFRNQHRQAKGISVLKLIIGKKKSPGNIFTNLARMSKCGPNCRPSISRSHVIDWSAALTRKKNVDKLTAEMRSMESLTEQSTHWKCYRVKKTLWWPILCVCKWLCVEQTSGEAGSQRYTLRVGFISACLQRPEGRVGSCGETLWCRGKGSTSRAQIVYFKLVCFGCWLSSFFFFFNSGGNKSM